jgi:hypothetical protein
VLAGLTECVLLTQLYETLPIEIAHCAGLICTPSSTRIWRAEEDDSVVRLIDAIDDSALEELLAYATTSGKRLEQKRCEILALFYNHQLGRAQRWPRTGP